MHRIYGDQGWWPLVDVGYHKGKYGYPRTKDEIFEISLGVILTQNTTFKNVEKSLKNLHAIDALKYEIIQKMPLEKLKEAIKPSGYFNQKSGYILNFIEFFKECDIPSRDELLAIKGIGQESADSILLYGYNQPHFVVDTYTKRMFVEFGLLSKDAKYSEIQKFLVKEINKEVKEKKELVKIYQEFHALIVEHAKKYYSKKPYGVDCPIALELKSTQSNETSKID
jgi:endonuclease-3 related protein